MTVQAQERLGGRYQLDEPIGYGGMGRVFRAHDELLDRDVAVKLVNVNALGEARAAAALSHPNIVHIFDVGEEGDTGYIVMELVTGLTLRDLLRQRGQLPPKEAAELAAQVADALQAAHRRGLIHCDVKPQNILVTASSHTKLVDFGIAQSKGVTEEEVRGTLAYVAPEQARGEPVDARADIYSLGVVLYQMLTGRLPARPYVRDPRIPPYLHTILARALAQDRARRFAGAAEMREALRAARRPLPTRALLAGVAAVALFALTLVAVRAHHDAPAVPQLVGHDVADVPSVLQDAGISSSNVEVQMRQVSTQYVGTVVDQQPQPGLPVEADKSIQIAVGVPQDATAAPQRASRSRGRGD